MPGDREQFNMDFGIEDTITEAGNPEVISAFFTGGTIANPDDVSVKKTKEEEEKEKSSTTDKTTTKPIKPNPLQKDEKKDDINVGEEVLGNEEENKDEDKGNEEKEQPNEGDDEKSTFAHLAEDFIGMGIFQAPEEGTELNPKMTPEEFLDLYVGNKNREINDTINGFLGKFGEDYRDMFNAVFVNGVDPKAYLQNFTKLQDIAGLDMTQESAQEKVYREYFKRQGLAEDKIEAKLQRAKANGELEEDSKDFHPILVDQEAKELEVQSKQKEEKTLSERRTKQLFAQNANKVLVEKAKDKEFDGIPLSDQIAKSAFDFLTQEKYVLPNGEPLTEFDKFILELKRPENHELKVKIALLALNKFDLSKVKVKEKNAEVKQAFQWGTKGKQTPTKSTTTNKSTQTADTFI